MFGITSGHKRVRNVAVVDIGSTSAAVAIIAIHPHEPASTIAAEHVQLSIEQRTQEATIAGIGESLKTAGENAQKKYVTSKQKGSPVIHAIYVITHAPWSNSKTARATMIFKGDVLITDTMISDLAKKALGDQGVDGKNLLEASVIRVELNGYPSGKPVGKHAKEIVVHVLVSDFIPLIRSEIEETLQKIFPHCSPVFHSATRAAITVLRERPNPISDYLLVDVESEGTTLTAVRNGVTTEHETAPLGLQTILKKISESGIGEETLSLIRMLARDQCSDPACEAIKTSIARAEPELVRIFGEAMGKSSTLHRLPDTLILIAHPDIFSWLSKLLSRIDFAQFTLTTQPFTLRKLGTADFDGLSQTKHSITEDPGLELGIGFVSLEQS